MSALPPLPATATPTEEAAGMLSVQAGAEEEE